MFRDIRLSFRMARSWRLGALAAVLTLAIGIGTASSMYAVVHVALKSSIPDVDDLPSLGRVYASSRSLGVERAQLTLKDMDLLAASSTFEAVGAYASSEREMAVGKEPLTVSAGEVTEGFFTALRTRTALGRLPSPVELRQGAPVAVLSEAMWRTHFPGRALEGAAITLDGIPHTVIGVLPAGFGFPFIGVAGDVWVPLMRTGSAADRRVSALARLKPGVTWAATAPVLDALARPQNPNGLWTWSAIPVEQDVTRRNVLGFTMMFGPALVVLLIGCTNVSCMLLARGLERSVELTVRSALGATRCRIASQLLAENLLLGFAGGTLGAAIAYSVVRSVAAALAQFQPQTADVLRSGATLLPVAVAFSVVACVLFGTVPAIRLSRRDLAASLKGGTMPAAARFVGYRARDLVVFVEIGVAVALIVTTALFVRFFVEMQRITPLFDINRLVVSVVPRAQAPGAAERISGLPGITSVALATGLPGTDRTASATQLTADGGRMTRASVTAVDAGFFRTMGIPILRGRWIDASEATARSGITVVSEAVAAALWPSEDPIAKRLTMTSRTGTSTVVVVGLARNAIDGGSVTRAGLLAPDIYVALGREDKTDNLLLFARSEGDPRLLVRPIREAARMSVTGHPPRTEALAQSTAAGIYVHPDSTFVIKLLGGFGIVAMLLAASGIFGVVSQSVAQRKTEFGVRIAMGASAGQVLRMVLVREAKLIAAAAGTGILFTVLVTRSTFVGLLTVSGTDPRLWTVVVVLCGGLAALAVALATYRITRLDPWVVLRQS